MANVLDVARYFLSKQDADVGEIMTNMKLQKLLYYAQGANLALRGQPLFREPIEAWRHGPVVRRAYAEYADHGGSPIPATEGFDPTVLDAETRDLLDEVYDVYGQFSAWRLREMTHAEPPWRTAWNPDTGREVISLDDMRSYFATLVDAG